MRNWLKTRGLLLAGWLTLTGMGWLALSGQDWLATWWVMGPVMACMGAVLLIWAASINSKRLKEG